MYIAFGGNKCKHFALQKEYETAKENSAKWEKSLQSTKSVIVDNEFLTWRLLDQIQQLYSVLCRRNGKEVIFKRHEVEKQLDYIKDEIETIQEIIAVCKKMMEDEARSDIAENGSGKLKK